MSFMKELLESKKMKQEEKDIIEKISQIYNEYTNKDISYNERDRI